ncbi:hypothetical protein [Streptomyces sp. BK239]|uniref:hypothetical protein n=1 Tax=Streptomyces sp. BK239 TaxID=2512155 RepID=UPI00102C21D3|nr:hypothetical protein [Streptomyces sp. BK239]RZU22100.1 hypothetical protein EV567_2619 [Streptomyces sp. BK239]
MTTVAELQPDPNKKIRIVSHRESKNGVYYDGIVRSIQCVNADENLYEVVLFSATYNKESAYYVYGTDKVTEPTRTQNYANAETDRQREAAREMFDS